MDTSVERLEGSKVRMSVTLPADRVDESIRAAYKQVAKEVNVPGFRKGHAPERVIDNVVGKEHILATAQEDLVTESYPKALDAEEVRPVEEPDFDELDLPAEGASYTYELEVTVRPELTLTSYEDIEITVAPKEVSEAEIDEQVDQLRDQHASLEPVEDRGIEMGDYALVSWDATIDDEPVEGAEVDTYLYELGSGQMPEEFEEKLVGMEPGETRTVTYTIPETTTNPEYVGKDAVFEVKVDEVKAKVLPEVDDEFAEAAGGYESVEDMREQLRQKMQQQKQFTYSRNVETAAREKLAERTEGEIPESMVSKRNSDMVRDFMNSLESQGISIEQYTYQTGMDLETLTKEFEDQAEVSIRVELALESLFRELDLEITDEDENEELKMIGGDKPVEELRERFEGAGIMGALREQIRQRKATEWLLEHITVNEEEPSDEPEEPEADEDAEGSEDR